MEDLINEQILENIFEEIQENYQNLVRHNDMSFFKTFEEAEKVLEEIVQQKFEEAAQ